MNSKNNNNLAWHSFEFAVALLPFFPLLAGLSLLVSTIISWKKGYSQLIRYRPNQALMLFAIWLLITSFTSAKPPEAWAGTGNFLPFMFYLASSGMLISQISQLRRIGYLIVIPSLFVVLLGIGQLYWGWESSPQINQLNLGWTLAHSGNPIGRMSSIFMYANILAAYLLLSFLLGLGLWLELFLLKAKGKKITFTLLSLTLITDIVGLVLSDSRNAWILAVAGCLAFAIYLGYRWLVAMVVAIAALIAGASWGPSPVSTTLRHIVPSYFWARLSDELYPNRSIGSLRTTQWSFAWDMMLHRPVFGWGLRNFSPFYSAQVGEWLGHPHNFFLMLLAEVGIPGTLIISSAIGWTIYQAIKILSKVPSRSDHLILFTYLLTFISCVLFNLFDVTLFNTKINMLDWILISAIWGVVYAKKNLPQQ